MPGKYCVTAGPYLAVRLLETTAQHYATVSCVNPSCNRHGDSYESHTTQFHQKFCPDCGSSHVTTNHRRMVKASLRSVVEKAKLLEDYFVVTRLEIPPDIAVLMPNRIGDPGTTLSDDEGVFTPTPELVAEEKRRFFADHKDAIAAIQKVVGAENCTVEWGIITRWH